MKKKFVLGALCVSMILASGIGASAEVSESHSQWAEESLISADAVSYTHLTLPTICSV